MTSRRVRITNHAKFMSQKEVLDFTSLSRSTLYLYISKGTFPGPVKGDRLIIGWLRSDVNAWLDGKIKERSWSHLDEELK